MSEFKWHLMADEIPPFGKKDYLVMGPKGGLAVARGFREGLGPLGACFRRGPLGPLEPCFHSSDGWSYLIGASVVYAWAEIPPLEVDG